MTASIPASSSPTARERTKAIIGGSTGNMVEWFDWYVYSAFTLYFAPVIFPDAWVVHVCAMTGGLVVGKMSHFFVAEKGAEAYTRRREAKEAREAAEDRRPTGPVRARFARWSKAMIDVLDRPRLGPLVMLASSGIGFPPLAVVTVAAGIKRVSAVTFLAVTTIGCLARFLATSWLVSHGVSLGH